MRALLRKAIRQKIDYYLLVRTKGIKDRTRLSQKALNLQKNLRLAVQRKVDFEHKMIKIGMMSMKGKRLMALWNAALQKRVSDELAQRDVNFKVKLVLNPDDHHSMPQYLNKLDKLENTFTGPFLSEISDVSNKS